jgi:hypothetical protein
MNSGYGVGSSHFIAKSYFPKVIKAESLPSSAITPSGDGNHPGAKAFIAASRVITESITSPNLGISLKIMPLMLM